MPDLIESEAMEDRLLVLQALFDGSRLSSTDIATWSGISLSAAERALEALHLRGKVRRELDNGTEIWSRT